MKGWNKLPDHLKDRVVNPDARNKDGFGNGDAGDLRLVPQAQAQESRPAFRSKTEGRYARLLDMDEDVADWRFEPMSFRIGDGRHYRPDFLIVRADGRVELHEVKGGWIRDRALVKPHAASELYPWFDWVVMQQKSKKKPFREILRLPNRPAKAA